MCIDFIFVLFTSIFYSTFTFSGWAGHVARMGEERGVFRVLVGETGGKETNGENLGVDGWIILGWICRRWDVGIWTGLGWPRIETGGGRL